MPYKQLPSNPSLEHLKRQARDLQQALSAQEPQAFQRLREFHPRLKGAPDTQILAGGLKLADFQLAIAREYCFASWPKLRAHLSSGTAPNTDLSYRDRITDASFRTAVDLVDAGDEAGLRSWLHDHPVVARQRVFVNIGDYFGQPALLDFTAENPIRNGKLPPNITAIARVILDAGAKDDRAAIDHTLGLATSGKVPRECGVQVALIDLMCDFGGAPDSAMSGALVHGEFAAVKALIRRGAKVDLPAAAALGRLDEAKRLLPNASPPDRHLALAYAAQFGRLEVARLLLEAGEDPSRFNPVGGHSHSTPLHQAALTGNLEMVKLLVEFGADKTVKDIMYGSTPLGWAEHAGQKAVADYLR